MKLKIVIAPVVKKTFEGHVGVKGHKGGSAKKGTAAPAKTQQPQQGQNPQRTGDLGPSDPGYSPIRQAALRQIESPENMAKLNKLYKKLGWDNATARKNTMTLMSEIQDEIDTYGSVQGDSFIKDAIEYGNYIDYDSLDFPPEMENMPKLMAIKSDVHK